MPLPAILCAKSHCRKQYENVGGALPRPYIFVSFRDSVGPWESVLLPPAFTRGVPRQGRGEKNSILPNSPSHGFRRASRRPGAPKSASWHLRRMSK